MKLSKIFDEEGNVDESKVESFKKEVFPKIPMMQQFLDEDGNVDHEKVMKKQKELHPNLDLASLGINTTRGNLNILDLKEKLKSTNITKEKDEL